MNTLAEIQSPPADADQRTYLRLNAAQVQIVADRLNSDRSIHIGKLAESLGISRSMFYYIIRGQHRTTPEKLLRIAEKLNINPKVFSG